MNCTFYQVSTVSTLGPTCCDGLCLGRTVRILNKSVLVISKILSSTKANEDSKNKHI
jgi:hypothetical protein